MLQEILDYMESALISTEDEVQIFDYISQNYEVFPLEITSLYRGINTGDSFEIGDIVSVSEKLFSSWSENLHAAEEFSQERGPQYSIVFEIVEGQAKGFSLPDTVDHEMEWLVINSEFEILEIEETEYYMLYKVKAL